MKPIALQWTQKRRLGLAIPKAWKVIAESTIEPPPPIANLTTAVRGALRAPIGSPPLEDLVGPNTTVALVMDDPTHPTPVRRLVPVILTSLLEAGVRSKNITGLFAVGAHEPMTRDAMEARVGRAVLSQIDCRSFDCRDTDAFAYLGRTRRGTPSTLTVRPLRPTSASSSALWSPTPRPVTEAVSRISFPAWLVRGPLATTTC